jgi:hypothetical protein
VHISVISFMKLEASPTFPPSNFATHLEPRGLTQCGTVTETTVLGRRTEVNIVELLLR